MTRTPLTLNPAQTQQAQNKLEQLRTYFETGQRPIFPKALPLPKEVTKEAKQKKEQRQQQLQARKERTKNIQTALRWLQETYPNCFSKDTPKPLKKRIEKDIFAQELPFARILIRYTLSFYTRWHKYLKSLVAETHRHNLQGEPVEEIAETDKAHALEKLKQLKERYNARQKNQKSKLLK
ncbi:ProQ/FINO family protein [Candidatus Odyssella thessalonicensis]|uniref:ProQ/FINO family protein n=1 Tax=Candidatus Odyssella thessalonicensis TaxID=84647 RepID=UPI000225BB2E|nr:ProQ/FinO family protein [Candidatus Odyssella thessalonicensis]